MKTRLSLLLLLLLAGCADSPIADPSGSSGTSGSVGSTSATPASASSDPIPASSSSGEAADTSSSSGSSSTGEMFEGPGCGATVDCDRGIIPGDVLLRSAEDLDALAGVEEIEGTLEIAESDLVCLDALACLRVVGGDVRILGNPALRSTAGLAGIEALGTSDYDNARGSIVVSENHALEELRGFDSLEEIQSSLTLWRNEALRELNGFAGLRGLNRLSITNHASLEALSGLHGIEELGTCNVNLNPALCISEVFEVCGDVDKPPQGVTNNNDDGC